MKRTPPAFAFAILGLVTALGCAAPHVCAQTDTIRAGARADGLPPAYLAPAPAAGPRRQLAAPRASTTAAGSRVMLAADAPLDDYAAYSDGARFYVLVPHAVVPAAPPAALRGRGFTSAQVVAQQGDVLFAFQLQPGARAQVAQKFNRLDIIFTARPAAAPATDAPTTEAPTTAAPAPPAAATQQPQAQGPGAVAGTDHELMQQLLRRIEELEEQVRQLQATTAATTATTTIAPPPPGVAPSDQAGLQAPVPADQTGEQEQAQAQAILGDEHDHSTGPHLQLQGFADVNFRATNQRGVNNSFALGQLDLFITSRLSDKFSVLSELIVQANQDNSFNFEIHRLVLRYAANDYFNASFGRYHTAIGYYNTAFHHGNWFATAANRPFIFAFESAGGPLPLHNTGVSFTGRIPSGALGLRYVAELGNGRSARSTADRAVQTSFDENNGKSFNLALLARPDTVPGLQTGFSFYRDHLTPLQAPNVTQEIMAGHIVYKDPRYEWLNEALVIRHKPDGTGRIFYTPAFYTQFARRFGQTSPYFRYQYVNAPAADPIFAAIGRRNGPSVGLRYDVTEYAAFKAQYDHTQRRGQRSLDDLILQLAFTF